MRIRTERLVIRPILSGDTEAIFELFRDPEVCRYYDLAPFAAMDQAEALIRRWLLLAEEKRQFRFAIGLDETVIGTCGIYGIDWRQNRASLGYDLNRQYWCRGYMREALETMIPYFQTETGLHRIQALVMEENARSIQILEGLGFKFEGVLEHYEKWEGKGYVNLSMYAKLS